MSSDLRAKEARFQLSANQVLQRHLNLVILEFEAKPRAEIKQTEYTGDPREVADLDVKGWDISFKQRERNADWFSLWKLWEDAEFAGLPFPTVTGTITKMYRSAPIWSLSLSGNLILKPDGNPFSGHEYSTITWSGTCRYAKPI